VRAATLGQPLLPEIAPITGPMYQLFLFFMITDPRTIVRGKRKQIVVTVIIAIVDSLIRLMSDMGVPLPTAFNAAPPLLALAIVGPIAKYFDLRYGNRSAPIARPATVGTPA
jgi:Na+-translocating ferredoxin:NAD+ oxidoreductase RnfD subunit